MRLQVCLYVFCVICLISVLLDASVYICVRLAAGYCLIMFVSDTLLTRIINQLYMYYNTNPFALFHQFMCTHLD